MKFFPSIYIRFIFSYSKVIYFVIYSIVHFYPDNSIILPEISIYLSPPNSYPASSLFPPRSQ